MEFLQLTEGLYHVAALCKRLGLLAKCGLGLEVLLEIEVTEFAVDIHHIIELLHIELVGLVEIPEVLHRYGSYGFPPVLDRPELREGNLHVLLLFEQLLEVFYHGLLEGEIPLPLSLLSLVVFCLFLLEGVIIGLEGLFYSGKRILLSGFRVYAGL